MASIKAGSHSIDELLKAVGFDFAKEAAADYNNGEPDFRRVRVGGLGFDDLEKQIRVPYTADTVEITLDGKKVASLDVELDDEQREQREAALRDAASDDN